MGQPMKLALLMFKSVSAPYKLNLFQTVATTVNAEKLTVYLVRSPVECVSLMSGLACTRLSCRLKEYFLKIWS